MDLECRSQARRAEDLDARHLKGTQGIRLPLFDRDGDAHRVFLFLESLRIGFFGYEFQRRLADLDIDVAAIAVELAEIIPILVPRLPGVDNFFAKIVAKALLFGLLQHPAEFGSRKHIVADKINILDLDLAALIDQINDLLFVRRHFGNAVADLCRPEALGVVYLFDSAFNSAQLRRSHRNISWDLNAALIELVLEIRSLDLLVPLKIHRSHERALPDDYVESDCAVAVVLDFDPHIFKQARVPQSPVAIDNRFTVERITRLEPEVVRDGVDRERHAAFDNNLSDIELLLGSGHRHNHCQQDNDGNSSRRHQASSP